MPVNALAPVDARALAPVRCRPFVSLRCPACPRGRVSTGVGVVDTVSRELLAGMAVCSSCAAAIVAVDANAGTLERLAALRRGKPKPAPVVGASLAERVTHFECETIRRTLDETDGNQRAAARLLRMNHTTLCEKMKRLRKAGLL